MNLRPRRSEPPRVDITPLIDVVFLMLIFFMVSTTFDKQTQLKVDLPQASPQEAEEAVKDKIEITIDPQGQFYVNERELIKHDAETLRRTLQKITDGRVDLPIIVSGDRNAPLQSMMTVMDVAAQLGMSRLSFVARQAEPDDAQ
jgi:biopolymer transport protein ExbD